MTYPRRRAGHFDLSLPQARRRLSSSYKIPLKMKENVIIW
jgi:hypothetical protein